MSVAGLALRPLAQAELEEGHLLVQRLIQLYDSKALLNGDKKPTVRCTNLAVPNHATAHLRSWKFDEFSYGKPGKVLPSYARGLFSYTHSDGRHEVVIRGYDKFFNVEEVEATRWKSIENRTQGPYDVSLKQNGCIIFIGALPDKTILVTSKHSLGSHSNMEESHAERGRRWLTQHLHRAGKTEAELANLLSDNKMTAVCELCDDEFEEHILRYSPEHSGLYLHGLNRNTVTFSTYSIQEVHAFAKTFGFLSNISIKLPDLPTTRTFLDGCARTGTYNNMEIEGFVVRTQQRGNDFFFKYKFKEPYLLFRQWREVTKQLIAGREPRYKSHQSITKEYLQFVQPYIADAALAKRFNANHGIIDLREKFLAFKGGDLAGILAKSVSEDLTQPAKVSVDYSREQFVLVPIATIGCGKTTLAVALQRLFGFGHVQNDNILAKKPALLFAKNVYEAFQLANTRLVIADRNNHMEHERASLTKDISSLKKKVDPAIHFIALSFKQTPELRNVTMDRVLKRGDNHQSIRAATMQEREIKQIMDGFHHRFQALDVRKSPDDVFSDVLEVDPLSGSRANLDIVINFLQQKGIISTIPAIAAIDTAFQEALQYAPSVYKQMSSHPSEKKKKKKTPEVSAPVQHQPKATYYGLSITNKDALLKALDSATTAEPQLAAFWQQLRASGRIQKQFHITLIHKSNSTTHPDIWSAYVTNESGLLSREVEVTLDDVVWDGNVMAVQVSRDNVALPHVNQHLHITIGTANPSIKPFAANAMMLNHNAGVTKSQHVPLPLHLHCKVSAFS